MTLLVQTTDALTGATDRFEHASMRLLGAVSGGDMDDAGAALADMSAARVQFKAAAAVIRFSNEMWDALLEIGRD
jgi:hypothetical protein